MRKSITFVVCFPMSTVVYVAYASTLEFIYHGTELQRLDYAIVQSLRKRTERGLRQGAKRLNWPAEVGELLELKAKSGVTRDISK